MDTERGRVGRWLAILFPPPSLNPSLFSLPPSPTHLPVSVKLSSSRTRCRLFQPVPERSQSSFFCGWMAQETPLDLSLPEGERLARQEYLRMLQSRPDYLVSGKEYF